MLKQNEKNICNLIFSDFKPVFFIFGGLVTRSAFSELNPIFLEEFFDTKLIL